MMTEALGIDEKVYSAGPDNKLSLRDLLNYFERRGSMRVSDLHLKVGAEPTYRVDGRLQKINGTPLDVPTLQAMTRALLSDEDQVMLKRDRSVDGSCGSGKMLFRFNCFFDVEGPAIAVRALLTTPPAVEEVGFPNQVWRDLVAKDHGLVLVTGITGAGKSTTIASLISRIADTDPCRIITLEDPVEYRLTGAMGMISQREVGRDVPSFERGLRDSLREDPDVIFVGEMRDRESAMWTLSAAETGHLVFSTLHTRDIRGTITRLLDMFPADRQEEVTNQLSMGLSHIICQKLVPRADGQGRVLAMEILTNTYAISNMIRTGKIEQLYSSLQTKTRDIPEERMVTLESSLATLVHRGVVDAREAEKYANHPGEFASQLRYLREPGAEKQAEGMTPKPQRH
jgi:twitching motility protein PilT